MALNSELVEATSQIKTFVTDIHGHCVKIRMKSVHYFFRNHPKQPLFEFKVALKSSWLVALPGKLNELLLANIRSVPENLNKICALIFKLHWEKPFF